MRSRAILSKMSSNDENKNQKKSKKVGKIIGNAIFYTVLGLLTVTAAFSITSRITGGRIGDSQYLVVISGSMDGERKEEYPIKTIPVKSLIKVDLIKDGHEEEFYSGLKKGDVLTFNYASLNNTTITHRIIEEPLLLSDGTTYQVKLKGDAVEGDEIQTLYSDGRTGEVIGKVSFVSLPLGQMYFFISSKMGTLVLVILPCSAVCIYEIAKIVYILSENKRKKKEEAALSVTNAKDKEIEELKAKLESLQKQSSEGAENKD